jgi:pantetheine-phosphate adenylyltransferase
MKTAIYAGTFDPITNGHLEVLDKACGIFDEVILAVAEDTGKNPVFSVKERFELCKTATEKIPKVKVAKFSGLVVDFAKKVNGTALIRGLRAVSDFEYELSLALMNKKLYEDINTIFFVPQSKYLYLSSTMIRQVVKLGGNIEDMIPDCVVEALRKKIK